MSDLHEVTANIRLQRLRRYVDEEIERYEAHRQLLAATGEAMEAYWKGKAITLHNIRTPYLLTPEESADAERTRREMFG